MPSIMNVSEITGCKKFYIFDEHGNPLGEENDLLSALAFARGALEGNLKQSPFEPNASFHDSVIINLSLNTVTNLMNAIRETSIMALSDYAAAADAYKRGCTTKEK